MVLEPLAAQTALPVRGTAAPRATVLPPSSLAMLSLKPGMPSAAHSPLYHRLWHLWALIQHVGMQGKTVVRVFGHQDDVNAVAYAGDSPNIFFSGSDDHMVKVRRQPPHHAQAQAPRHPSDVASSNTAPS